MIPTVRYSTRPIALESQASFALDVRVGLCRAGQKELPSKYLYNAIGSALFDAICLLPEYGLSRADARLLQRFARDIILRLPRPVVIAELGSGSGQKTRWLLEELAHRQPVHYYPIDISGAALARCRQELGQIECVSILGFERAYLDGLLEVAARRHADEHLLVLFLGGTIGNFDRGAAEAFLAEVRQTLLPGDALLLSADLEKSVSQLLLAYDDPAGVTAAFNKNLLARINRELGGDFCLEQFAHQARWNDSERAVEMHLRSRRRQRVNISVAEIGMEFLADETIWTETSHRYLAGEVADMGERAGYRCEAQWVDEEWPFAQSLFFVE
jgi:L-histidine N-alpha-methyltransferase